MARPLKQKSIEAPPDYFQFKPQRSRTDGPPGPDSIQLRFDEWEVYRLAYYLGMDHAEGAGIMGISRPTFSRLVETASQKMAQMLIEGKALYIAGGKIHFSSNVYCCKPCRRPFKWEKAGPPLCPECGGGKVSVPKPECRGDCTCCEESTG